MITRLEHINIIFKSDNASVYSMMEEAAQVTVYDSTIKTHDRKKNGRAACKSMVSSRAGQEKWEQLQKEELNFMMQTKCNGRVYRIEKFVGLHRNSFVQMQEADDHVNFQFPTEHLRVGLLIYGMSNSDIDLHSAIASVHINTNNMCDDFEGVVGF